MLEQVDNLTPFAHPHTGRRYRYMRPREVLAIIAEMQAALTGLEGLPWACVHSGSWPLGHLLARSLRRDEPIALKVPRQADEALIKYVLLALDESERRRVLSASDRGRLAKLVGLRGLPQPGASVQQAVRHFAPLVAMDAPGDLPEALASYERARDGLGPQVFNVLLARTRLAQTLAQPIVLIDEYVTSGTVLSVVNRLLALFARDFRYRLLTYSFNMPAEQAPPFLERSVLYGPPADCQHAYPFENRLDLLGFFYVETPQEVKRVGLTGHPEPGLHAGVVPLLSELVGLLSGARALQRVNAHLDAPLRAYNGDEHLQRFALSLLADDPVDGALWEQLFEMYAPCWSPLPPQLHLAFTAAYQAEAEYLRDALADVADAYAEQGAGAALAKRVSFQLGRRFNDYWDQDDYRI